MIHISIIMPVFNAEKTLHKSIKSIISQTKQDWELIIIDDGSTDSSPEICDYYARIDNRIKVLHKNNEGVAMARQDGINLAQGEYSIHIDSDDWVEYNMLEELFNEAKKKNIDILICNFYSNIGEKQILSKQKPSSFKSIGIIEDLFNNKLHGSLCNKLIRTKLYIKYNARFFNGINHCEDLLILVQLLQHYELNISYYDRAFYHYVMNSESITNNFTYETYKTRLRFRDKLEELLIISNSEKILNKVSFDIFTEAFIYNVLSRKEIYEGINIYKEQIKQIKSLKWRFGFFLIKFKQYKLAHKLIHY